jgi:hypothetical protein
MHDEEASTAAARHLFPSPNPRLLMYREDGRPLHEGGGRHEEGGCDGGGRGSGDIGELGTAEGLTDSTLDGGEDSGKSTVLQLTLEMVQKGTV